ncbi:MAG: AAA family ATPase [Archangium sp.]
MPISTFAAENGKRDMATEPSSGESSAEQQLVLAVLQHLRQHKRYPTLSELRGRLPGQSAMLDALLNKGFLHKTLTPQGERVGPSLAGLLKYGEDEAKVQVERFMRLLPILEQVHRKEPEKPWPVEEISALSGEPPAEVSLTLRLFAIDLLIAEVFTSPAPNTDLVATITFSRDGIDPKRITQRLMLLGEEEELGPTARLSRLRASGYRALEQFDAQFEPLTVIIGANGAGKSSLFDLLAFISFAAVNPIPPEVDPRSTGKTLFHLGGPEAIELGLHVDRGVARPLQYNVKLSGPIGVPQVVSEHLTSLHTDSDGKESEAFTFLDFKGGRGSVQSVSQFRRHLLPEDWFLPQNEFALRRALAPTLVTLNEFREYVSSWKFYAGFDVGMTAAIRRPVFTETDPILKEDGSNLSAVLFHLMTEHQERWEELQTHLRSAIPAFQSLHVKSRGGPGTVMAFWREAGVKGELTLADLSDGTLKFLCWATLCLSPRKPLLICIDEPELGLHPRVLPVLAGLLRQAATESQFLVTTHSPYFLSQFSLDEIAVMKKVEGRAVFARPASNQALRQEIEELGSGELVRLHLSDELEVRS